MPILASVACALVVTALLVTGTRAGWYRTARNFEGHAVAVAGTALMAGLVAGLALAMYDGRIGATAAFVAAAGFGAAGALDDFRGDRSVSGFRGHLSAAAAGRLTTGFWKIAVGGLTALLAAWLIESPRDPAGWGRLLMRASLVALAANAWNLMDTRPARATAAFLALAVPLALVLHAYTLWVAVAGALAFLPWDRRRIAMLGDAGSNTLGALWAVALAAWAAPWAVGAALLTMAALNIYTERRSLNTEIAARPWLARLDGALRGSGQEGSDER